MSKKSRKRFDRTLRQFAWVAPRWFECCKSNVRTHHYTGYPRDERSCRWCGRKETNLT